MTFPAGRSTCVFSQAPNEAFPKGRPGVVRGRDGFVRSARGGGGLAGRQGLALEGQAGQLGVQP
ncbi:hypothetical protein, partial [Caulobacter sp. CCUG 60055]|uniref:hypothetical protein n=1 Tax=Caulobacter sp. CCUG 60055 TaxID=2100090 RepID=UPI001FA7C987